VRYWGVPKPLKKKPAGSKRTRPPQDVNQWVRHMVDQSTAEPEPDAPPIAPAALSAYMAAIGARGGRIGGKRRMETMTFEQRSAIGVKAARARWPKGRKRNGVP
jgi:hypothetical protein